MTTSLRKCAFTNRPILPKERDGVQMYLAELDSKGRVTGKVTMLDICGSIRKNGEVDDYLSKREI